MKERLHWLQQAYFYGRCHKGQLLYHSFPTPDVQVSYADLLKEDRLGFGFCFVFNYMYLVCTREATRVHIWRSEDNLE